MLFLYIKTHVYFNLLEKIFGITLLEVEWKQVAVINIIAWSSCHRQSVRTDPTNTFHSLHFPHLLFRLQAPQQCVCVYVPCDASAVPPDTLWGFFPFHEFLVEASSEVAPICLRRVTDGAYLAEMFTVGSLQHLASMLPPWKSCPLWFFTLARLGPGVVPGRVFMLLGVMLDARHRHHIQTTGRCSACLPSAG